MMTGIGFSGQRTRALKFGDQYVLTKTKGGAFTKGEKSQASDAMYDTQRYMTCQDYSTTEVPFSIQRRDHGQKIVITTAPPRAAIRKTGNDPNILASQRKAENKTVSEIADKLGASFTTNKYRHSRAATLNRHTETAKQ